MSLARFRLRHGQRSTGADPRFLDVDGSDPPLSMPSTGIAEGWDVHIPDTLLGGSLPSSNPLREGCRPPEMAATEVGLTADAWEPGPPELPRLTGEDVGGDGASGDSLGAVADEGGGVGERTEDCSPHLVRVKAIVANPTGLTDARRPVICRLQPSGQGRSLAALPQLAPSP